MVSQPVHYFLSEAGWIIPFAYRSGTSAASQGPIPRAIAWAIPNLGTFRCHRGLKCTCEEITSALCFRKHFSPLWQRSVPAKKTSICIGDPTCLEQSDHGKIGDGEEWQKLTVRQILPPRYIFDVFPSSSGRASSGAVAGY